MSSRLHLDEAYPFRLWLGVGAALMGSFQSGYQVAVLNTALDHVSRLGNFYSGSVLASPILFGAVIGAASAGALADAYGPRKAQLLNSFLLLMGSVLSAVPWWEQDHFQHGFVISRCLTGIGVGAASMLGPRYVRDIGPRELRVSLCRLPEVMFSAGIFVAYAAGLPYWCNVESVGVFGVLVSWWRIMVAAGALLALVQAVCLWGCPESPSWLETWDKEKADEACIALWGSRAILYQDAGEDDDMESIPEQQKQGGVQSGSNPRRYEGLSTPMTDSSLTASLRGGMEEEAWLTTLGRYQYRRVMMLAMGLPLLQQACGISAILMYSAEIFPELGFDDLTIWGCLMIGLINVVVASFAVPLSDWVGRRPVMIASYAGMSTCLFAIAIITFFQDMSNPGEDPSKWPPSPPQAAGWPLSVLHILEPGVQRLDIANACLLFVYTASHALGAGPVTRQYLEEILPKRIKANAMSLGVILEWLLSLLVAISFLPSLQGMGIGGIFMIFGVCSVLGLSLVVMMMVESRGASAVDLERLLILPPRPQLRYLFPGAHSEAFLSSAHQGDRSATGTQRSSTISALGHMGSMAASGGAAGPASNRMAADAWAKLLMLHERQQLQQGLHQAGDEVPQSL